MDIFNMINSSKTPICTIQKLDDSAVITINTKTTWYSGSSIDENTFNEFFELYRKISPGDELIVNLKTTGGYSTWCVMIANVIHKHKGPTVAEIEQYAFSGGTVIALACDKIRITEVAALGPINPYSVIPVSTKHTEKLKEQFNWTSMLHEYMSDREESLKIKMNQILIKSGYSGSERTELIDFFMYRFEHNTPIGYELFPECLKKRTEILNYRISDQIPVSLGTRNPFDGIDMFAMMDQLKYPERVSPVLSIDSFSDSESDQES
jgi:hypothetical protein